MNKYELAVIVNAALEEEERVNTIEKVKEYIVRFAGNVTNVDDWGKKRLAYEIQKSKEAYYYFIQFESENSNCPNEVEENLRIMENVVRFLCVKKEA
jgi:small subunit ribosomal protein S6